MEALMIRWRIVAQRWTPGGSEFMDPDACEAFIVHSRNDAAQTKVRYYRLVRAAQKVLDGLHARIDAAPRDAVPLFHGIVDLADELNRVRASAEAAGTSEPGDGAEVRATKGHA